MDLNGSNLELLFEANTNPLVSYAMVADLAVDTVHGKVYWTNTNGLDSIGRANLDGSVMEVLVPDSAPGYSYRELQLDVAGGKMYWTANDFTRSIECANLDGSSAQLLVTGMGLALGFDLDLSAGKMYWANGDNSNPASEGSIQRTNLDGTNLETLVADLNITSFINLPALSLGIAPNSNLGSWVTGISPGPADEAGQTLTFSVTGNSNPSLFAGLPAISPQGVLTYTPAVNANGVSVITVALQDNGGTANSGVNTSANQTFTITVTPVNDAPSGANKTLTTNEDTTLTIVTIDFGFSDVVEGHAFNGVKITTLPAAGTLKLNGVPVSTGAFVTKALLDANQLTFAPAANANGSPYTTFTFQVEDNGDTLNGGVNLDQTANTITINVAPAPVYDFSFDTFSDVEGNATNTTNVVTVTRSARTDIASSVQIVLASGAINGATVGNDFTAGPITLYFGVNETSQTVPIELLGDTSVESDETIDLSFTNLSDNGNIGTTNPTATLTINDNDSATVSIAQPDDANETGTVSGKFTVTQTTTSSTDTVVSYSVLVGSTAAGGDGLHHAHRHGHDCGQRDHGRYRRGGDYRRFDRGSRRDGDRAIEQRHQR